MDATDSGTTSRPPEQRRQAGVASADRLKAFADAVVAIAMTLLILPLMDSVSDVASAGGNAGEWIVENREQLFSFALSFVLIGAFWMSHHRLFDRIHRVTPRLLMLTIVWMFTIVWLPVATSILGLMEDDAVQKTLYIGSLFATSAMITALGWYALRHLELHDMSVAQLRSGILADAISSSLFVLAYILTIAVPTLNYLPMFLLFLTNPLHRWLRRYLPADDAASTSGRTG